MIIVVFFSFVIQSAELSSNWEIFCYEVTDQSFESYFPPPPCKERPTRRLRSNTIWSFERKGVDLLLLLALLIRFELTWLHLWRLKVCDRKEREGKVRDSDVKPNEKKKTGWIEGEWGNRLWLLMLAFHFWPAWKSDVSEIKPLNFIINNHRLQPKLLISLTEERGGST